MYVPPDAAFGVGVGRGRRGQLACCVQVAIVGFPDVVRAEVGIPEEEEEGDLVILCGVAVGYEDEDTLRFGGWSRGTVGRRRVVSLVIGKIVFCIFCSR